MHPARRQTRTFLEHKPLAYAAATGALLAVGEDGRAAIIYCGVQNVPIGIDATVDLDLNGDAVVDSQFQNFGSGVPSQKRFLDLNLQGTNQAVDDGG